MGKQRSEPHGHLLFTADYQLPPKSTLGLQSHDQTIVPGAQTRRRGEVGQFQERERVAVEPVWDRAYLLSAGRREM
jgi:hypothetical protein